MKDMAAMQPGMSFYSQLPDSYNLIVNTESPIVKRIREAAESTLLPEIKPLNATIVETNDKVKAIRDKATDGKLTDEQQGEVTNLEQTVTHTRHEADKKIADYAAGQPLVKQTIDLALLANGLLKGSELSAFIARSVSLL